MRNISKLLITCAGMVLLAGASTASAATLIVDGGQLIGATGVEVNGSLYDVQFVEENCRNIFGCLENRQFDFDAAGSIAASLALSGQVFIDTGLGNFDSIPSLTYGCSAAACEVWIPYNARLGPSYGPGYPRAALFDFSFFKNYGDNSLDATGDSWTGWSTDTTNLSSAVFARFAPAAAVPEPATWALMLLGFGLVGGAMRSKKRQKVAVSYA